MKNRTVAVLLILLSITLAARGPRAQDASGAYRRIIEEIQSKSKTVSPYALMNLAEKRLLDFLKEYPDAHESAGAHLMLGKIYSNKGNHNLAVNHLEDYFTSGSERESSVEASAKYLLASSHLKLENFDAAEKLLRGVLDSGGAVDKRVTGMASKELERIQTLRKITIGSKALDFSAVTYKGKKIKLADFKGKVVLLDFWAVWCGPCKREMPNVKKIYGEFHNKGFEIIGISLDSDESMFKGYVNKEGLGWPQVFDGGGWMSRVGRLYAVDAIPATILLDRDGKIRHKNLKGQQLAKAVEELLAEK